MIISNKYCFIYVRVAKTGSSSLLDYQKGPLRNSKILSEGEKASVKKGFANVPSFVFDNFDEPKKFLKEHRLNDINHIPLFVAKKYINQADYKSFFKFGFVRNPFDRMVSAYEYSKSWYNSHSKRLIPEFPSFKNWVLEEWGQNGRLGKYGSQGAYLEGGDFIGRFENLQTDFTLASKHIGKDIIPKLPILNQSKSSKSHYSKWYDNETIDIVAGLNKNDLEKYNYDFYYA